MSRRLLAVAGSQARSAALVAAALVVGASGAMALSAPDSLLPTSGETEVVVEPTPPLVPVDDTVDDDVVNDQPVDEDDPADDVVDDETSDDGLEDADEELSDDASTDGEELAPEAVVPVSCEEAVNHGQYVSGVARSTEPGPGHGQAVREAAQSDCGKPAGELEAPETEEAPEVEEESDDAEEPKADKPQKAEKSQKAEKAEKKDKPRSSKAGAKGKK